MKFLPIILICSSSIPVKDCKPENKDVIVVTQGEPQNTPMSCLIEGQTRLASIAIAPKSNDGTYYKVKCVPKELID